MILSCFACSLHGFKRSMFPIGIMLFYLFIPCLMEAQGNKDFTICTWNLGHFSKGQKPNTVINAISFSSTLQEFLSVLNDSIRADVICFNEYNKTFGVDEFGQKRMTKDLALSKFGYLEIGPLLGFSCNAIFSKFVIRNVNLRRFEISETVAAMMPRAQNYYYLECDLYFNKERIKLICAHTTSSASAVCQSQISEILNRYKNNDKVIMCGDWNTQDYSLFKNSGYILGNNGSHKTYPNKGYALDNIAVKGLRIADTRLIKTVISDHYPLVCRISFKEAGGQ